MWGGGAGDAGVGAGRGARCGAARCEARRYAYAWTVACVGRPYWLRSPIGCAALLAAQPFRLRGCAVEAKEAWWAALEGWWGAGEGRGGGVQWRDGGVQARGGVVGCRWRRGGVRMGAVGEGQWAH